MAVHEKVKFKMEQIARYRVAGMKDAAIASAVHLSIQGLQRILHDPDYPEIAAGVQATLLGKMDTTLAEQRCDPLLSQMESAIPLALQALVDGVQARRGAEPDLKTRMEAAKQLLDRDPRRRFSITSRSAPADGAPQGAGSLPAAVMSNLAADHAEQLRKVNDLQKARQASQDDLMAMQPVAPGVN